MTSNDGGGLLCIVTVGWGSVQMPSAQKCLCEPSRRVISVQDRVAGLSCLRELSPELVLVWENIRPSEICQFIQRAKVLSPKTPVVIVSDSPRVDHAVRFIRAGAFDYVPRPFEDGALYRLVEGLTAEKESSARQHRRFFCEHCPACVEIVGRSPGIVNCLKMLERISHSRCNPVLILGETGTGKELAARAVQYWRYGGFERYVAVNCATLTANLLESELFGHVKGSFTGADRDKAGLFEQAADGSIFLDEISEMPPRLQAKLLRVLQERAFRRVGGTKDISSNATVIASSNRNLLEQVEKGRFRRDLYYRLAVFPIIVPPLRQEDRRSDICLLAEYFLESADVPAGDGGAWLTEDAKRRLMQHDWLGNVRELRNVIERAMIVAESEEICASNLIFDLEQEQSGLAGQNRQETSARSFSLEAAEREFIMRALKETGWQRTRAAALLGITRATLHAKLKRYGIEAPGVRRGSRSSPEASGQKSKVGGCPAE